MDDLLTSRVIGYDAKRAVANFTGLGNYSRFIISSMAERLPDSRLRLYIPKLRDNADYARLLEYGNVSSHLPAGHYPGILRSWWRTYGMAADLRRDGVELFHGLSNELPTGLNSAGIRSVVTIHDLIFLRYPEYYGAIDRRIYDKKFKSACRNATRVVAVSECTKRDIVQFYDIDPDKIDVVYQGCSEVFAREVPDSESERVRRAYRLPERFMLNVGSIESRKNLLLAVKALSQVDASVHLVAVGRHTVYTDEVVRYAEDHGLSSRLHILHRVNGIDLPVLYRLASLFVYPSYFEGFGIPIIEALNAGVPVIGATGSCLEEAGGPDSLYVDPDDATAMAEAMNRVLSDEQLRESMITRGRAYVRRFDRASLAEDLLHVYRRCLE